MINLLGGRRNGFMTGVIRDIPSLREKEASPLLGGIWCLGPRCHWVVQKKGTTWTQEGREAQSYKEADRGGHRGQGVRLVW